MPVRGGGAPVSGPRRLHAIAGLVPVGAFLAFHLYENAAAASGPDVYNAVALRLQRLPLAVGLEAILIVLPLAFHAVYGFYIAATVPADAGGRPPALAVLQRLSGIFVFAFVFFHLWTTRLVQIRDHESLDLFRLVQTAMANPWIRSFYAAGILAAAFHLAAGLWSFPETWGLALRPRQRVWVAVAASAIFVILSTWGLRSLAAFRL